MSSTDVKLTKKEKKALSFRANKGKSKSTTSLNDSQNDIPEVEDLDAPEVEEEEVVKKKEKGKGEKVEAEEEEGEGGKTKKRKRVEGDDLLGEGKGEKGKKVEDVVVEGEGERKKKRQRGKKKSEQRAIKLEEGKSRLILFVGNLPFKVTVEEILTHFAECGEVPQVRLLTPKPTGNPSPLHAPSTRSKGCCFLEFKLSTSLQAALRQHESEFVSSASVMGVPDRKINVELSAGGGGNSEGRKNKLVEGRKRLEEERERTKKNKAVREGEAVDSNDKSGKWNRSSSGTASTATATATVAPGTAQVGGKKVRDRRLKKPEVANNNNGGGGGGGSGNQNKISAKALAAMSGSNSIKIG